MFGRDARASTVVDSEQLRTILAKPSDVPVNLDVDYFSPIHSEPDNNRGLGADIRPLLLSEDYDWLPADASEPRVPLQLCEFLAYKAALAYESEDRIRENLEKCCEGIDHIKFFDSSGSKVTDTRAYAFRFENKAFVIFRGTEGKADWSFNLKDMMTDELGEGRGSKRSKLKRKFRDLAEQIGDPNPGRHLGFALSWVAVKDDIKAWLDENGQCPVVVSGHSLGGALALLAAFDFAREFSQENVVAGHNVAGVVTFGAPLVGNGEFAEAYDRLLGSRTVRLESSGDMVPAIMRRWYYRWLYFLRKWAVNGLRPKQGSQFQAVGKGWTFAEEAPLSLAALAGGIRVVQRALQKAAKEMEKKEKEKPSDEEKSNEMSRESSGGSSAESSGLRDEKSDASKPGDGTDAIGSEVKSAKDGKGRGVDWGLYVIIAVLLAVFALAVWTYIRRKVFSHDIQQRYALYLSTLSYQQLRQKYGGDLVAANAALDEHLRIVRGNTNSDTSSGNAPFFSAVNSLPVKLESRDDMEFFDFLKDSKTFV